MDERPILKIPYSIIEKIMECISAIIILINVGMLLKYYKILPTTIPTHFNVMGVADKMGNKSSIFIIPSITFVLYFFLTVLSRFPDIYNYLTHITYENAEYQYRCARQFLIILKTEIMIFFTFIEWRTIELVLGKVNGLGLWIIIIFLIFIVGTLIIYVRKSLKNS